MENSQESIEINVTSSPSPELKEDETPPDKMVIVDESPTPSTSASSDTSQSQTLNGSCSKKSVLFDKVTIYHFHRSQGFSSIPSQGGSTLGMKRRHFLRRRLSVDLFEEVRRRSRREILLRIKIDKERKKRDEQQHVQEQMHSNSTSSSNTITSDDDDDQDDEPYSDLSDISDSELENNSYIFLQPLGVKLRRSLLRASGVGRIDPIEKRDCKKIRESRERSGCKCVDQCFPGICECIRLGVNCHVDRVSFPCGCVSNGCQNPLGRTEFDSARVRGHFEDKILKARVDPPETRAMGLNENTDSGFSTN